MATPFSNQDTNTINKEVRFPTFRKTENKEASFSQPDTSFGPVSRGLDTPNPQPITQQPLFQQAQKAAETQLGGEVEGFEQQAQIARETAKAVQAQTAKAKREQLIQSGIRDTGTYVGEGLIQPEEEARREMLDLERRLAVNRGELEREQIAAGQTAASNLLGIASGEKTAQQQIASQEAIAQLQQQSEERIAFADLNLREKQLTEGGRQFDVEADFKKYALDSGYTEAEAARAWQGMQNQKRIESAEKIAFAELSVKELALAQEGKQFTDRLEFDKYATDRGYDDQEIQRAWQAIQNAAALSSGEKIAGMEIASREKIAQDENLIRQQGLTLQQAELYGYTDENGNHIAGLAEQAAAQLGLQEKTLDLQQKELFGYTDEQGVYHKGKYDLMNDAEQRAADALYGYQIKDDQGNVIGAVPGSLQLEADRVEIDQQGLDMQEAQIFGYDKADGTHVDGQMDLQMKKYGLEEKQYADNHLAMFGGVDPATGEQVQGQMQIAAAELGLKEDSLQLQKEELFGYTDENGVFHKGKYDLLSDEQKLAADELYGYTDPNTGEYVPGKWDQIKDTMQLQHEQELKVMQQKYGYDRALQQIQADLNLALQNDDQAHAMELIGSQQKFTAEQAALDRALEWVQVNLEKSGFDYAVIKDQIESGAIGPEAAVEFTKGILKQNGIEYTPPDPNAVFEELDRDYRVQQYQFALTHPDLAEYNADGTFKGLKEEGAELFQSFLNTSYYGPDGKPVVGGADIKTGNTNVPGDIFFQDGSLFKVPEGGGRTSLTPDEIKTALRNADNPNSTSNQIYQQLAASAEPLNMSITNIHKNSLTDTPAEGSMVVLNGRLMMITKGKYNVTDGRNHQAFKIMDLGTGTEKTFTGLTDRDSVNNMGSWATELGAL